MTKWIYRWAIGTVASFCCLGLLAQTLTQPRLIDAVNLTTIGGPVAYIGCPATTILQYTPAQHYQTGTLLSWTPNVNGSGGATTINICGLGVVSVKESDGATNPTSTDIVAARPTLIQFDGTVMRFLGAVGSGGTPGPTGPNGATGLKGDTGATGAGTVQPYTLCAPGCSSTIGASPLTVTASTHGQGSYPTVQCFLPGTPLVAVACTYTQNAVGDLVFTYSGSLGLISIQSAGNSGAPGTAGATGATGVAGATGAAGTGAITVQSGNLGVRAGGAGTRVVGTQYHNTNSYPIYVQFGCLFSAHDTVFFLTDSNATPTQYVALSSVVNSGDWGWVGGWVLPGNYYYVAGSSCTGAGANGPFWTEWH